MIEEMPIPQAWEWFALRELSSVVQGLAVQGFDSPGDLNAKLREISDAIAQVYQGGDAAVFETVDKELVPAPPSPYSQRKRKQLQLPFKEKP